ncbi:MAG: SufS family cysteine desulfurase [Alphaproteobacteria bacterium]|nr:SufS family cysteine desulfurase [Alphaproteobacteria bacterium]
MFDAYEIRKDFPILNKLVDGKRNTYLDTAASAQKPLEVIECVTSLYMNEYANVHRGSYWLSDRVTEKYENARKIVQQFVNAKTSDEIVFVRNATEGINLVASTYGLKNIKKDDEILISRAEHHANLVTWQQLAIKNGAKLKYFDLDEDGGFNLDKFVSKLTPKTKFVAFTAMSNVLGTIFPIKKICELAHKNGAKVLVDACQYAVHKKINVQEFDADFLVFSSHKVYGPTGVGVLYGKYDLLCDMPPYQYGGDMIEHVYYDKTIFTTPPARFEAGTPAIVQAIGLGKALEYLMKFDFNDIEKHERELTSYATRKLLEIDGLKILGTAKDKGGVFAFDINGIHPQDLAFILGKEGVGVRTGHFCAEPLVNMLGYTSLTRASLGIYSVKEDIDILVETLKKAKNFLS